MNYKVYVLLSLSGSMANKYHSLDSTTLFEIRWLVGPASLIKPGDVFKVSSTVIYAASMVRLACLVRFLWTTAARVQFGR